MTLSTEDLLSMIRLLEAQQSVIEQLAVMADVSLCQRCHAQPKDGYKYCTGCKRSVHTEQAMRSSRQRRQAQQRRHHHGLKVAV